MATPNFQPVKCVCDKLCVMNELYLLAKQDYKTSHVMNNPLFLRWKKKNVLKSRS